VILGRLHTSLVDVMVYNRISRTSNLASTSYLGHLHDAIRQVDIKRLLAPRAHISRS
jgi:hypothetical protein